MSLVSGELAESYVETTNQWLKWVGCPSAGDGRKGQISEGPPLPGRHKGGTLEAVRTGGHDEMIHIQDV